MTRTRASALLLLLCLFSTAEGTSTRASEFWIIFGPNLVTSSNPINPQLVVVTSEPDTVTFFVAWDKTISRPITTANQTFTVTKGSPTTIDIPVILAISSTSPSNVDLGIHLKTLGDKLVTVIAVNEQQASTDAYVAFPKIETKSNTYEYYALSVDKGPSPTTKSFLGLVTLEPQTECTISLVVESQTTGRLFFNSRTGSTFAIPGTLAAGSDNKLLFHNPGMTTAVVPNGDQDLSGTRVVCDKPITFITGHQCGLIPTKNTACDHMVEQVPPTETWGFNFMLVPLSTREADGYRILTSKAQTRCDITCTDVSKSIQINLANAGDFRQFLMFAGFCSVECNRPVLIFQYSLGHSFEEPDLETSDPFIIMMPPVGQYYKDYDLGFFASKNLLFPTEFQPWVNIAIPTRYDPSGLRFNGAPLQGAVFVDIMCKNGEVCGRAVQYKSPATSGTHLLSHINPDAEFSAVVYGWEIENTYGYVAGMTFDSIAAEIFCLENTAPEAVESSGEASFAVTRTGSAAERSCIGYNVVDVSTQGLSDYVASSGECCLEADVRRFTCHVDLVVDFTSEDDEVMRIELNPKQGQCVCDDSDSSIEITITEPQGEAPVFVLDEDSYIVDETSGTVRVAVRKVSGEVPAGETSTVTVTPTQGSDQVDGADPATAIIDWSSVAQDAVFSPGDEVQFVHFPIVDDTIEEGTEYFFATAAVSAGVGTVGTPNTAVIFIRDNDFQVVFDPIEYNVTESVGVATVTLRSTKAIDEAYNVTVTTQDGSATAGSDYSIGVAPFTATFAPGETTATVQIPIRDDDVAEFGESFTAAVSIPSEASSFGAQPGSQDSATVFIEDDDEVEVNFDPTSYTVNEDDGHVTVTVVASSAASFQYTVQVTTTDGNATAGSDYSIGVAPFTATFAPGETTATVEIPIRDDDVAEFGEFFSIGMSIPNQASTFGVQAGSSDSATVFIEDDDEVEVNFDPTFYIVNEDKGHVTVTVVASSAASFEYTVEVTTVDGNATAGSDYSIGVAPFTVTFAPGETTATVQIPIRDDDVAEFGEFFSIGMSIPNQASTFGVQAGSSDSATVFIEDDDEVEVNFDPTFYIVNEDEGHVTVTVVASSSASFEYTVEVTTVDGNATAGSDYSIGVAPFTATFAPGETTATVQIPIRDDDIPEFREFFTAVISIPSDASSFGVQPGSQDSATVYIEDDDDKVQVNFDPTSYIVNEDEGHVTVTVVASSSASFEYTVEVTTTDGNATAGSDYSIGVAPFTVTFAPGETTATVQIPIRDDDVAEFGEFFSIGLSIPNQASTFGVQAGSSDSATVFIEDDDEVEVNFDPTSYTVNEDEGSVLLKLNASAPASFDYTVEVSMFDGTAKDPSDYAGRTVQVVFKAGSTSAEVAVPVVNDTCEEGEEQFVARLSVPSDASDLSVVAGASSTATITIQDDDEAEVQFGSASVTAVEDQGVVVLPIQCGACGRSFNFSVTCTAGTAKDGTDFEAIASMEVTCRPGSDASLSVTIADDTMVEPRESFTCRISDVPGDEVEIVIVDDDSITVNFSPTKYSMTEDDGLLVVTVVASAPSSEPYTVYVDTRDGTDPVKSTTEGEDYAPGPYQVIFQPGMTETTVLIPILTDQDCECDEIFTGQLRVNDSSTVALGVNDTATFSIVNDDDCRVFFSPEQDRLVNEDVGSTEMCLEVEKNCIGDFEVCIRTEDGPDIDRRAIAGSDYEEGPHCVQFAEGMDRACTRIPIIDDEVFEVTQDFRVHIEVPNDVPLTPGDSLTVTIIDEDFVTCAVEEGSLVVLESDGSVNVLVTIDREVEDPVDCFVSTRPITATDVDDFEPFDERKVTFLPQMGRTQPATLRIVNDNNPEPVERLQITANRGGFIIQGGNTTDPSLQQPAINVTIIDDDDRCQLGSDGSLTTFFSENMLSFNRSCPFQLISACPQDGQDAVPFQIQIDLVRGNVEAASVAVQLGKATLVVDPDGEVTMTGDGNGITVSKSAERVIVQVESVGVVLTRTLGSDGQIAVSVSNSSDLVLSGQLCGLCGNEKGMLVFADGSPVAESSPEDVNKFLGELSVPLDDQLFGQLRRECAGTVLMRANDTVIGDPLYEVPLSLSDELLAKHGPLSLCYEIHGKADQFFNLISDTCASVNAHYSPMINPRAGNIISQIGVVAEDNSGQCQQVQVDMEGCVARVNGAVVTNYNRNGVLVLSRTSGAFPRVRISVPNCNNVDLVMWVVCEVRRSQPMIKFVVSRGINLTPTSHGLIAQFWNVDVTAEAYTVTESDRIQPSDEHFAVTVHPTDGSSRRFFADIHPVTWDHAPKNCLYAGSGQGGKTYEVPSLPDTVIQGRYSDYATSGLFDDSFKYKRFESDC